MTERETHALLISGDEPRFMNGLLRFQRYLQDEVGLNPRNIRPIFCNYMGDKFIMEESEMFFDRLPTGQKVCDVVLFYVGHGGQEAFFPNYYSIGYEEWAKLIRTNGDFIFLNESCHSGSAVEPFLRLGLLPQKGLLIASSQADETSRGLTFLDALIESYRSQKPFRRKKIWTEVEVEGLFTYNPRAEPLDSWRFTPYKNRLRQDQVQHPVRRGKTLDHILFSEK